MRVLPIIPIILLQILHSTISPAQQINVRKYTIENGLVNNDILNIYQDRQGFIWLCTRGGLSRYDGSRFTNYTTENGLTNDMINDIIEIAPQEFIIAQNSNGPRSLKYGQIEPFLPYSTLTVNNFYKGNNNELLATTDNAGIVMWDSGRFNKLDPDNIQSFSRRVILNDSVWLVLIYYSAIQLVTPSLKPVSPLLLLNATVIYSDLQHRTWIGTVDGLKLLNPEIKKGDPISFVALPRDFDIPILRKALITDFTEDSRGNFWIGTNNGLVKVDRNGKSTVYTQQDGLPISYVVCIEEDVQNNLWIGTPLGLAKFSLNNEIRNFPLDLGLSHDGTLLISPLVDGQWRLFDGHRIYVLDLLTGKLENQRMVDSSGYWIYKLNEEQLMIEKGNRALIYHNNKENPEVINWQQKDFGSVTRIDPDNFVASFGDSLFIILNGEYKKKLLMGVHDNVFHLIVDKNNFLWAGTQASGLFKIRIHKNPEIDLEIVDTIRYRLPDTHIRTLYSDKGNELWVGTRYKGVVRIIELPGGEYEIQTYGTREGLSSNFVRTINRDSSGNVWVGTRQGIDKLIPEGKQFRVFNFGKVNSYFSPVHSIYFLKDNYLLSTSFPSLMFAQDKQLDSLSALPVYITKVFTGTSDSLNPTHKSTTLPYNKAQIYFEFSAPQFINEDLSEYSYRLLGASDTNWTISGKSHSVYFANLRPGNYAFEVKTLGFDGKWGKITSYSFLVTTPFWQKEWFIVLILLAVAMVIFSLYRYRIRQLVQLQKVRNRIATDLHDEIGSNLTNISILSNLSKKSLSQPDKANNFLQRISEEVSSSSQALDDIIWSVNANHDTLEETVSRMRRYAAELFDAANISYDLYLDPTFDEEKLDMEQRRDIYLLYKEAVNNISKHAGAKQVTIEVAIEHQHLLLQIKDDGIGFDTGKQSERHGLNGMKERVNRWKGRIDIRSVYKMGTSIEIRLPLSK